MKFTCTNCGKTLKTDEQVYFRMPVPARGFTELQAWLKLNDAKPYCLNCLQIVQSRKNNAN